MDVFMPIALCVIFIILFTICGWCCKRKREGTVYGCGPPVTVTTTTQHFPSPQIVPPYPIDARHPMPGNNAPGFAIRQPPYPTQVPNMPFPQSAPHIYGLPPPNMGITGAPPFQYGTYRPDSYYGQSAIWNVGFRPMTMFNPMFTCRSSQVSTFPIGISNPPMTPYPPAHYHDYNSNPPPYEVAISQAPAPVPRVNEGYGKQAPYNPGYN